jgi:hypothetical protein
MPRMRSNLLTGVETLSSLTWWRDAISPVGTRPPQRMRAVLLISIDGLSSHRFASSVFNGFSAPNLISTLLGDVMAAAWVQKDANWDGFSSSNLVPLNSPGRNAIESIFFLFLTSLKFFDQTRKSKTRVPEETEGNPPPRPPGPIRPGRPACPGSRVDSVWFSCALLFLNF